MRNKINLINKHYNKKELPILLEQYKLISESADKITDKRQSTNNFYLGVNSFILAVASYLAVSRVNTVSILISISGLLVSVVWLKNINSFKQLNSAKFKVIHELEEYLPARVYQKEDEYLQKGYYKLTAVEKWIPVIFGVLYVIIILISL